MSKTKVKINVWLARILTGGPPLAVRCRGCAAPLMPFPCCLTDAGAFTPAVASLCCGQMSSFLRQKTAKFPLPGGEPHSGVSAFQTHTT